MIPTLRILSRSISKKKKRKNPKMNISLKCVKSIMTHSSDIFILGIFMSVSASPQKSFAK